MLSFQQTRSIQFNNGLWLLALLLLALGSIWAWSSPAAELPPVSFAAPQFTVGTQPLSFIANAGQTDSAVRFQVNGMGQTIFFTPKAILFSATHSPAGEATTDLIHLSFRGANPAPVVEGLDPLPGMVNFFRGNDPAGWQRPALFHLLRRN